MTRWLGVLWATREVAICRGTQKPFSPLCWDELTQAEKQLFPFTAAAPDPSRFAFKSAPVVLPVCVCMCVHQYAGTKLICTAVHPLRAMSVRQDIDVLHIRQQIRTLCAVNTRLWLYCVCQWFVQRTSAHCCSCPLQLPPAKYLTLRAHTCR